MKLYQTDQPHCRIIILVLLLTLSMLLLSLSPLTRVSAGTERISIGDFGGEGLNGWEAKSFKGETDYRIVNEGGTSFLLAQSQGSGSGLIKKQDIDLSRTPYLNWSWQARRLPEVDDEQDKAGDDYAARVYVIFSTGPWFWNTHALNYVWNRNYPRGTDWPNAFTSNARMLALRDATDARETQGGWQREKRNVRQDLQRIFGEEIDRIEAVAIMTDSDNSGTRAVAAYGDISFTAQ